MAFVDPRVCLQQCRVRGASGAHPLVRCTLVWEAHKGVGQTSWAVSTECALFARAARVNEAPGFRFKLMVLFLNASGSFG